MENSVDKDRPELFADLTTLLEDAATLAVEEQSQSKSPETLGRQVSHIRSLLYQGFRVPKIAEQRQESFE
ncbi:MAG: hypothetical protein GY947_05815 [Rhodobacteraceae bacterium]|nr:hypothetical protein [Paracoccaceae bacterium]